MPRADLDIDKIDLDLRKCMHVGWMIEYQVVYVRFGLQILLVILWSWGLLIMFGREESGP